MLPGFVFYPAAASYGVVFSSLLTTEYPEALIYGRRVRVAGASRWNRALPGGSRQTSVGVWGSGRQGRRPLAAAHPIVRLCTIREPPPAEAAMPTLNPQAGLVDSQTLAASIYGGQWSSIECAAASGSRPCRPAASACRLSLPDLSLPGAGARARSGSAGGAWSRCRFCRCTRRSRPD